MNPLFSRAGAIYLFAFLFFLAGLLFFMNAEWNIHSHNNIPATREDATVKIVRETMPSVVNISTRRIIDSPRNDFTTPFDRVFADELRKGEHEAYSLGSGSIITKSGLILTNAHVVYRASEIEVTLSNGKMYPARILAFDYRNDIALLQLVTPPDNLIPIKPAAINDLMIGETVLAIGNSFGLDSSVTKGILSAVNRKMTYNGKVIFSDIIQTDAGIYPGNSGGPLINMDGNMIGMTMSHFKDTPSIGFAMPLFRIENTLLRWMIPEKLHNLSLGIIPQIRITGNGKIEFYIDEVFPGSPAEKSGLRPGDIMETFDGLPCRDHPDIAKRMNTLKTGDIVTLTIKSNAKKHDLVLEPLPSPDGLELAKHRLGLSLEPLTRQFAQLLHLPFKNGLIVSDIPENSKSQFKRGDLLVALDSFGIITPLDIAHVLADTQSGETIIATFISVTRKNDNTLLMKYTAPLTAK